MSGRLRRSLKASLWCVCVPICLMGCRKSSFSAPPPDGSEKSLDVASVIAGCTALADCERDCSAGKPAACVSAGRSYEYGYGVAADPARAYTLYSRSCDLGYSGGCYNTALLRELGRGVPRDLDKARELYAKVCQMGSNTACDRAESLTHHD